ncbi:hypothetical protein [Pseudorhodobacter aquimaris]|uniref:hypothetical protein n=1 Tax=Pseudorhodobacter aquimaris TaxID=687412 RepID=UPI00067E1EC8|nr:hypothetical protein [Pseudorhodobacter aquimaris]
MKTKFCLSIRAFSFCLLAALPAQARPAKCLMEVNGKAYIDGACDFEALDKTGSFKISAPDFLYFAYVNVDVPGIAKGYWNEEKGANHAHTPLGTLKRDGACWRNKAAKLCAW